MSKLPCWPGCVSATVGVMEKDEAVRCVKSISEYLRRHESPRAATDLLEAVRVLSQCLCDQRSTPLKSRKQPTHNKSLL